MSHAREHSTLKRVISFVEILLAIAMAQGAVGKEAIWIEGEDCANSSFNGHGWYRSSNLRKDLLSPGEPGQSEGGWHVHFGDADAIATYRFRIDEGGSYTWWVRLNPFRNSNGGGNYSYRHRSTRGSWSSWQTLDTSDARDRMIDLVNPGIDIRFIAWCYGAAFDLTPGGYELQIRLSLRDGEQDNHGGIDVMAMTNFPWAPTGTVPPDMNAPDPGPGDWFMLMIGPDSFSPESIIDLSGLIDKPAGTHGLLQSAGKDFAFEDGTPIKFWGIDASMAGIVEAQQRQAQFYAKHGINMIRQHPVQGVLGSLRKCGTQWCFDPEKLDRFDRWFSILKDQGIYMTWSIFYHHVVLPEEGIDPDLYNELPDSGAGKDTYGMATFVQEYQDSQWRYAGLLLNHVNPYTGLAYKDDPTLAIVEARNEDSIFFHNPLGDAFVKGKTHPHHTARLKKMWQQWVRDRYGDDETLAAAWGAGLRTTTRYNEDGSVQSRPDSVDEINMAMYAAWEMQADGPFSNKEAERKRMGDFVRFLAEMQRKTYRTYQQRLRNLGYRGVVVSTAWKAGGPAASAANLWTDDSLDAIDRHNYSGGGAGGHGIAAGAVSNETHLSRPGRAILSSGLWQVEDKPFIMTEWTQKPPNQWKAEIAPLVAFYGMGLQGWDASYHFAGSRSYMGNGWPSMNSYVTETPHYIGQFPALAFAIYHRHFDEGSIVAARRLATDEIFAGVDALKQQAGRSGYDENELLAQADTPVEALAIGRVTLKIADDQAPSQIEELSAWWDRTAQRVRSNTGQLVWDYDRRVVRIQSDKTQGVVGFAQGGSYDLPGVTIENVGTTFVSLLLTPLDNRPLVKSQHILITAMARDKQYGAEYNDDGTELLDAGGPPLLLEPVQATLSIQGGPLASVKVVDVYGVPTDRELECTGNTFRIDGRYATYYYELVR